MKILALDSSGLAASVAVVQDDVLLAEYTIQYKKTHSQTLLPMLAEIAQMTELDLQSIDAIAVAAGPGSFTGLRIGSATAKGLGLALKKPILSIPTLEGLAYNLYGTKEVVCPIMDARRGQVYSGVYEFVKESSGFKLHTLVTQRAASMEQMLESIQEIGRSVIFAGDGIPVFKALISEKIKVPYSFAPPHRNRQSAASVAALGCIYYQEGKIESPESHQPVYLRLSQAERERLEKSHDSL